VTHQGRGVGPVVGFPLYSKVILVDVTDRAVTSRLAAPSQVVDLLSSQLNREVCYIIGVCEILLLDDYIVRSSPIEL